ncbi:MAG: GntR family transcriptional regulator [Gemmatimonadota bacterium]
MTRKAGSIVIDRLRDRIRLGRYFGRWSPGDRLPSVREVALLEAVDRKTAAAAYRRLQREGLVRVEPRSGVYLEAAGSADGRNPLRRLHRQWLESALTSAGELGLDADTVNRMFQGVAAVEKRRIPVVDPDPDHAALIAHELRERTGLDCAAARPEELPARVGPLHDPPFVIATPAALNALGPLLQRVPVVILTLDGSLFDRVCEGAQDGEVMVIVGSRSLEQELARAFERGLGNPGARVTVRRLASAAELEDIQRDGRRLVVWPGTPDWVRQRLGEEARELPRLVSDGTLAEIRCHVARAALQHVSTSSAAARR